MEAPKRIKYKGRLYEAVEDEYNEDLEQLQDIISDDGDTIKKYGYLDYNHEVGYIYGYVVAYGDDGIYRLLVNQLAADYDSVLSDQDSEDVDWDYVKRWWKEHISPYKYKYTDIRALARKIIDNGDETRFLSDVDTKVDLGNGFVAYKYTL